MTYNVSNGMLNPTIPILCVGDSSRRRSVSPRPSNGRPSSRSHSSKSRSKSKSRSASRKWVFSASSHSRLFVLCKFASWLKFLSEFYVRQKTRIWLAAFALQSPAHWARSAASAPDNLTAVCPEAKREKSLHFQSRTPKPPISDATSKVPRFTTAVPVVSKSFESDRLKSARAS